MRRKEATNATVVIFSDASSVLQALQNPKNKEMDALVSSLPHCSSQLNVQASSGSHPTAIFQGMRETDRLAKDGRQLPQDLHEITFEGSKDHSKREAEEKMASATDRMHTTSFLENTK